jgi:beta-lactam-binding protein with PASTA domain
MRGIARHAASLLVGALTIVMPMQAQTPSPFQGPVCAVPPTPQENDTWPQAGPDSLGNLAGPTTFTGAFLLANDRGTNLSIASVATASSAGGTISGSDPYTYTPPALVTSDVFTYEIRDTLGQTTVGIVKVGVIPDIVNPSVSISAPAADSTVSGLVTIQAVASDNVGVARVQFFVDDIQLGNDLDAPFSISWDSRTVADGLHRISALARDAAGNPGESAVVGVNVLNAAPTVSVPSVVGLAQAAAQSAITAAGLTVGAVTPTSSATVPSGNVISQNPTGGTSVTPGSAVALVVSTGPASAAVPSVVGMTQAAAQSAITAAGFSVGVVATANSATVAAGLVINQSPAGGTSAVLGSSVGLTVSVGPAMAPVPDVVGKTQAVAQSTITGAGFSVGAVATANSATVAAGLVISQNPTAGTSAALGSSVGFTVSLGPVSAPPANGLVLALGFDEASGTVAIDSSASAKNGAIREAVRVPGKFGSALKFDGVNDWVTVADTTASPLDLTTGMTLEAWVNPTQMSGWNTVMYKERGTAGAGLLCYALYAHDGSPEPAGTPGAAGYMRLNPVLSTTDSGVRSATQIPLKTWTHIATTYDGTNQRFYVNGVLVQTVVNPGAMVQSNGALRIGGNNSSFYEFFAGLIDEVRVYNRALSAAEITTDMNTAIVR